MLTQALLVALIMELSDLLREFLHRPFYPYFWCNILNRQQAHREGFNTQLQEPLLQLFPGAGKDDAAKARPGMGR